MKGERERAGEHKRMNATEQALHSNVADNPSAPANQDEDALMRFFYYKSIT